MNKSRKAKETSNNELARMIAEGFSATATKNDLKNVKDELKNDLKDVKDTVETIADRLRTVEAKLDRALYREIDRLEIRVKKLEQKVRIK